MNSATLDQHGLRQEDFGDCVPQNRISEILVGKRAICKEIAVRFARQFNVHTDVFL